MKVSLKGDLLEASFEGHLDVAESLQTLRSGRAVDAERASGSALVRRAGPELRRSQRRYPQGADQLGPPHLGVRGCQGGDRRQRGQRRAGPPRRRRASSDRRRAGVQRLGPHALRRCGALANVPVRPSDGIVVGLRPVVPPHSACRCRLAHLLAEGRRQGLWARPRCRNHYRALGQAARRHRRARALLGQGCRAGQRRCQRACLRATRSAARWRTSRRGPPGWRCSARRCSPVARRWPSTSPLPARLQPRSCARCRGRWPSPWPRAAASGST